MSKSLPEVPMGKGLVTFFYIYGPSATVVEYCFAKESVVKDLDHLAVAANLGDTPRIWAILKDVQISSQGMSFMCALTLVGGRASLFAMLLSWSDGVFRLSRLRRRMGWYFVGLTIDRVRALPECQVLSPVGCDNTSNGNAIA